MWLFKTVGMAAVLTVSAAVGFLKAEKLSLRRKKLLKILVGMSELNERIRLGSAEIEELVKICFEDSVSFKNGALKDSEGLTRHDIHIVKEFFSALGMSDSCGEQKRISSYCEMIRKQCAEAEEACQSLCKLYRTLGIAVGVALCIFFL